MGETRPYVGSTMWAFAWAPKNRKAGFVTSIVAYSRKECEAKIAETLGYPWKDIYASGGRIIKCRLTPV